MDALPWFPALTSTSALAVALWLSREWISTRLTKGVQHDFDTRLEQMRAELRASEERLKAQLREKEAELAALRSGALSSMASRQAALDKRRLEAVDQIWSAVCALQPAFSLAKTMSLVKFEAAADETKKSSAMRQVFDTMTSTFDTRNVDVTEGAKARPFVAPMVWATYTAMLAVVTHTSMQAQILRSGTGLPDLVDKEKIANLVEAALPHFGDHVRTHGTTAYWQVLDALETKLQEEFQTMLSGRQADQQSLEQAAEILRRAGELTPTSSSAK